MTDAKAHWEDVYATKGEAEVSWFQETPDISLDLIAATGVAKDAAIIDVGGGASRLVDALLARDFSNLTVLDISQAALDAARARIGAAARRVAWIAADATQWEPTAQYDVWHDRAAFHFLTEPDQQRAYLDRLRRALVPGGHLIIGTFAPDGPERCSGLPVQRHDGTSLGRLLGEEFALVEGRRHDHTTPWGSTQHFQFSRFRRRS